MRNPNYVVFGPGESPFEGDYVDLNPDEERKGTSLREGDYVDLAPEEDAEAGVFGEGTSLREGDYVDLVPNKKILIQRGVRKFKNPRLLKGRNIQLKNPINGKKKLVQMTLKGEKATLPPPKKKRGKKPKPDDLKQLRLTNFF